MKQRACAAAVALALVGLFSWRAAPNNPVFFGDPFAGLSAERAGLFFDGKDEFEQVETAAPGLGPGVNGSSCAGCHSHTAARGGNDTPQNPLRATTHKH